MTFQTLLGAAFLVFAAFSAFLAFRGLRTGEVRYLAAGPFTRADKSTLYWLLVGLWLLAAVVAAALGVFLLSQGGRV